MNPSIFFVLCYATMPQLSIQITINLRSHCVCCIQKLFHDIIGNFIFIIIIFFNFYLRLLLRSKLLILNMRSVCSVFTVLTMSNVQKGYGFHCILLWLLKYTPCIGVRLTWIFTYNGQESNCIRALSYLLTRNRQWHTNIRITHIYL